MKAGIIVKKSKISGKGVFAARDFKKGEVVLKWKPKILKKSDIEKLSSKEKSYVLRISRKYVLMQPPERYVNHSCEANTYPKNGCDIANRNIKKGEEITSDYTKEDAVVSFECRCESKRCKKFVRPSSRSAVWRNTTEQI